MAKNKLLFIPQFEEAEGGGGERRGGREEGYFRLSPKSHPFDISFCY